MNFDWQSIAAAAIVIAAVVYVTRRIWSFGKLGKRPPCIAGCSACGPRGGGKQLVRLKPPPEPPFEER